MNKNIIKLTESDLIKIIKRVINEQSEKSSLECTVNISKNAPNNIWEQMDPVKREQKLKEIEKIINQTITKSIDDYTKWFKNPLTVKKFTGFLAKKALGELPNYLKQINRVNIQFNGSDRFKNARAWVNAKEPYIINYNLSQLHDGNDFTSSIYDTTKHEMGHLIDYFFKKRGVKTYNQTIDTSTPESYQQNYIVNDQDQYTRLNVLRGIIDAGPTDDPLTLLNKFMKKVNSGKITSNKFNFSAVSSNDSPLKQKNDTDTANQIMKVLEHGSIIVDNKDSHNIEQLFSNFAINKGGDIFVNFNLIADLNFTSKEIKNKYYFLKLSPK